uniref:Uncharacterized protein n=1 Tax=Lepeophtheirus salmonis TaxID=72036 RepID=A0A0K2UWF1_LEPSM
MIPQWILTSTLYVTILMHGPCGSHPRPLLSLTLHTGWPTNMLKWIHRKQHLCYER